MIENKASTTHRPIAIWLYIGVFMLVMQIVIGGITRLTESGLSITEWKPITGVMPPLNDTQWQTEFDKYKTTGQYQYMHADFTMSDFKKIFFWEWLHRNWARFMGLVFLAGFIYFLVRRRFTREMILPLVMLFFLGAIQGAIGWIMVQSGLMPDRMFVGHIELAAHFIAALILLAYTLWFALSLSVPRRALVVNKGLKSLGVMLMTILFFQMIYGAFMAGLHAAMAAPTWPDINGSFAPPEMNRMKPVWQNWVHNRLSIQFIHRMLAYALFVVTIIWWRRSLRQEGSQLFYIVRTLPVLLVTLQLFLGILTVIRSPFGNNLLYFGVAHQTVGILYLMSLIMVLFLVRKQAATYSLFGR